MSLCARRITTGAAATSAPSRKSVPQPPGVVQLRFNTTWSQGLELRIRNTRNSCSSSSINSPTLLDLRRSDYGIGKEKRTASFRCRCTTREAKEEGERKRRADVAAAAVATVVLGVGNRVLYKLALVPLKQYPFFLAQLATFGYVVVYFTILYFRHRTGIVTNEMLSLSQARYLAVGLLEALGAASGMAAGTADTILKEVIFLDAAKRLKGRSVDLFVVNSFGSAYQALFICLLLPFLSKLWGIPFTQLPSYLKDGAACFLNINNLSTGCNGAPLLPVLFVIVNMGYNISLLRLLKISSAVVSCLASTVSVPLSVFVFTLPLPYLGAGTALPPGFVAGAVILVLGLLLYTWRPTMVPASATT